MEKITTDDTEPSTFGTESHRRELSDPLGTTDFAINRYRLAPGDGFPGGLHAHADQEEVFVVVEGEATFETLAPRGEDDGANEDAAHEKTASEGREVIVGAGEAIRFAPGEFQSGRNDADTELVAFALGAPRDSDDVRIPVDCTECGRGEMRIETGADGPRFVCPDCDSTRVPRGCPECEGEMHVALGEENGTVVVCGTCGVELDDAPLGER